MNQCDGNTLEYDYIIVGSGPAGAIIAKTLSDNFENSVLLLEAGDNDSNNPIIVDPRSQPLQYRPQFFWPGQSSQQTKADGKIVLWTTGRTLGGASSVNGMQYVRPTLPILREWERLLGPAWSVQQSLDYFKQLENYIGYTDDPDARGYRGPINIRQTLMELPPVTQKLVLGSVRHAAIRSYLTIMILTHPLVPFFAGSYISSQTVQEKAPPPLFYPKT